MFNPSLSMLTTGTPGSTPSPKTAGAMARSSAAASILFVFMLLGSFGLVAAGLELQVELDHDAILRLDRPHHHRRRLDTEIRHQQRLLAVDDGASILDRKRGVEGLGLGLAGDAQVSPRHDRRGLVLDELVALQREDDVRVL